MWLSPGAHNCIQVAFSFFQSMSQQKILPISPICSRLTSQCAVSCTCRDPRKLDISRSHCSSSSSAIQGIRFVWLVLDCWIHLNLSLVQATWSNMGQIEDLKIEDSAICLRAFEMFTMASAFCHWKPLGLNLKCYAAKPFCLNGLP